MRRVSQSVTLPLLRPSHCLSLAPSFPAPLAVAVEQIIVRIPPTRVIGGKDGRIECRLGMGGLEVGRGVGRL